MTSTFAPAFFNASSGENNSDCSKPSVAIIAIFLFSSLLIKSPLSVVLCPDDTTAQHEGQNVVPISHMNVMKGKDESEEFSLRSVRFGRGALNRVFPW